MREAGTGADEEAATGGILTVTPNPSLDLLHTVGRLVREDANRVAEPRVRAGGQGINVARVAAVLGGEATAVTLLGGASGDEIRSSLAGEAVDLCAAAAGAPTRTFVAVFETDTGHGLLLNSPGPKRSPAEEAALFERVADRIERLRPAWVAGCGSLPPGFATGFYRRVGFAARADGARFVPDCDLPALADAVRDGCDLLVPNRHEAERLTGRPAGSVHEAALVAHDLLDTARIGAAITLAPTAPFSPHASRRGMPSSSRPSPALPSVPATPSSPGSSSASWEGPGPKTP